MTRPAEGRQRGILTMAFHKVLFSRSGHGTTAGLVVNSETVDIHDVAAVSRLFPYSAARFMRTYHVSPAFGSWAEAFDYVFPIDVEGNAKA
jgi:hypothetical protein